MKSVRINRDDHYSYFIVPDILESVSSEVVACIPDEEFDDYLRVLNEYADWQEKLEALVKSVKSN